jgi:hypothetical protein
MAIYEVTSNSLRKVEETSFAFAGIKERSDFNDSYAPILMLFPPILL